MDLKYNRMYIEKIEERHYIVMPFNNKWYKLKMEFDIITTNISVDKPTTFQYLIVCSICISRTKFYL